MGIEISCEPKSKKLYFLIFIFMLSSIFLKYGFFSFNEFTNIEIYIQNISKMLLIFPYIFANCYNNKKINSKINKVKAISSNISIKDYIIFILIIFTKFLYILIGINNEIKFDSHSCNFFKSVNLLIFIPLLIKYFSYNKFYNHKILSLTVIAVVGFFTQLLHINNSIFLIFFIYASFLNSIVDSYQQYLINNKNISLYKVCFFYGLINFILYIFRDIIFIKIGHNYTFNEKLINIKEFYKEIIFDNFTIIFLKSLYYIILYIIIYSCYYLIIYNFSIIHATITKIILYSLDELRENDAFHSHFELIMNIFAFFIILINYLIYIEIIEISFFQLNKYTRRNILKRAGKEKMDLNDYTENIEDELENKLLELSTGYVVNIKDI